VAQGVVAPGKIVHLARESTMTMERTDVTDYVHRLAVAALTFVTIYSMYLLVSAVSDIASEPTEASAWTTYTITRLRQRTDQEVGIGLGVLSFAGFCLLATNLRTRQPVLLWGGLLALAWGVMLSYVTYRNAQDRTHVNEGYEVVPGFLALIAFVVAGANIWYAARSRWISPP
jgi:hypothetical protein